MPGVYLADAQKKAGSAAAEKPTPSAAVIPTYVPPAVEAAAVPARPKPEPKATSEARPDMVMPEIVQVYAFNDTKTYYPLDCGKQPEGSFKIAKSMAVRQGYKLAKECGN